MARHHEGYTLVELLVVISIFAIVMSIISVSFNRIVSSSGQIVKSAETDIGGLIGLELLRCDLELAGFGLPWSLPGGLTYNEAGHGILVKDEKSSEQDELSAGGCSAGCLETDAASFNDAPGSPPRAFVSGDNFGYNASDYLVLKGSALGMSHASRRWSYLSYTSNGAIVKRSKPEEGDLIPGSGERVIVLKNSVRGGQVARELVTQGTSFSLAFDEELPKEFRPKSKEENLLVYGIAKKNAAKLQFPFNRADYYISRGKDGVPSTCAPHTGLLYKTALNQDLTLDYNPILNCVADLQVSFILADGPNGETRETGDISPDFLKDILNKEQGREPADQAEAVRALVREVRVFILAQQGKKDRGYRYPASEIAVGDRVWTQSELADTFGKDWLHYRWKVYRIAVQPSNL